MRFPAMNRDDKIAAVFLAILCLPVLYFSLLVPFEAESGDNIVHFYFARYAFLDPRLYLDLWAKPVFTLLASPFAWFGFPGIKLFNGLVGISSGWIAYLTAKKLGFRYPWLAILFVIFAPTYFVRLFSAFTEPLFGLFLIASLYLVIREKYNYSALLVSFTPFIRAEGFFIIAIFVFYLLLKREWKAVPWLAAGTILLSVAGITAGKNLLWVFTDIPYAVNSDYGSGNLTHYAEQWLLRVGVPLAVSSLAGLAFLGYGLVNRRENLFPVRPELYFLLPALFVAYFLFHTLSWYFGLFTSYGLIRVLMPLVPLQALISLFALQYLFRIRIKLNWLAPLLVTVFTTYVLVFPFLHNPASINWEKDFRRTPEMLIMQQIAGDIKQNYPGRNLYYSEPYMSYALGINHFDKGLHSDFTEMHLPEIRPNSVIIWDNWSSVAFCKYKADFESNPHFECRKIYSSPAVGREIIFKIYLTKD